MAIPSYMNPFILPCPAIEPERAGALDIYRPKHRREPDQPLPAVIFVPGGPLPPEMQPRPRDWPVFRGVRFPGRRGAGTDVDTRFRPADALAEAGRRPCCSPESDRNSRSSPPPRMIPSMGLASGVPGWTSSMFRTVTTASTLMTTRMPRAVPWSRRWNGSPHTCSTIADRARMAAPAHPGPPGP